MPPLHLAQGRLCRAALPLTRRTLRVTGSKAVLQSQAVAQKPQLFGTDGVRGVAGEFPLDPATVCNLGRAIGTVLTKTPPSEPVRVVLGEDTRESSGWISRTLADGLRSAGATVVSAGVITTPGVAFLTRHHGFSAGIVVSASHNPYQDNGIKVLSSAGMKLSEVRELAIEQELARLHPAIAQADQPQLPAAPPLLGDYITYLLGLITPGERLSAVRLVVDCAHGASSRVVPDLLRRLGIEAHILNASPNGRNINLECGSLHPERMAEETRRSGADLGVAFDGDADRAIFATREGRILDGDHVLYSCGLHLHRCGRLKGPCVVGTLMTNLGLELALARQGVALKRTPVGDRYVLEEMLRSGLNLGGEPSGHIIFSDISLAGDGLITLLQILRLLNDTGESLEELVAGLQQFPQIIRNVRVRQKVPLDSIPQVEAAIAECRNEFGEKGRVVVRYSGTEKLARVMVEAEEAGAVHRHAARIAEAIEATLGAT
jgi:phosphoglucosamine mutase